MLGYLGCIRRGFWLYDRWPPKLLIADEVGLGRPYRPGVVLRQAWLAGRAKTHSGAGTEGSPQAVADRTAEKFNLNWPIFDGLLIDVVSVAGSAGEKSSLRIGGYFSSASRPSR